MPSGNFSKNARNQSSITSRKTCGGNKKGGLAPRATGPTQFRNVAFNTSPTVNFKIHKGGLPCPKNYSNNPGGQCSGGVGALASTRNRGCKYNGTYHKKTKKDPVYTLDLTELGYSIVNYETIANDPEPGSEWYNNPFFRILFEEPVSQEFPWRSRNYEGYYFYLSCINIAQGQEAGAYRGQFRINQVAETDPSTWLFDKVFGETEYIGFDSVNEPIKINTDVTPSMIDLQQSLNGNFVSTNLGALNNNNLKWQIIVSKSELRLNEYVAARNL